MRYAPGRADLVAAILALEPFPRADLAAALTDPQLAVRLGALEALEQAAGDDFGFDPWAERPETNAPPGATARRRKRICCSAWAIFTCGGFSSTGMTHLRNTKDAPMAGWAP